LVDCVCAGKEVLLHSGREKNIYFFHNFSWVLNSIIVLAGGAIARARMALDTAAGAASPSCAAHSLILALSNCGIGISRFGRATGYDLAGCIRIGRRDHPRLSISVPSRATFGFKLFFYVVGVAGYRHEVFSCIHNFVSVFSATRIRGEQFRFRLTTLLLWTESQVRWRSQSWTGSARRTPRQVRRTPVDV